MPLHVAWAVGTAGSRLWGEEHPCPGLLTAGHSVAQQTPAGAGTSWAEGHRSGLKDLSFIGARTCLCHAVIHDPTRQTV